VPVSPRPLFFLGFYNERLGQIYTAVLITKLACQAQQADAIVTGRIL